jgi:hypothetical protein
MAANYFQYRYVFGKKKGGANSFVLNLDCYRKGASDNAHVIICLAGFDAQFTNADHHFKQIIVRAFREPGGSATTIPVRVTLGLRDGSGNWDDAFQGEVWLNLLVIDNEPDVLVRNISIGLSSRRDARRNYFIENSPEGEYHAVGLMSGFEYLIEQGDAEISGIGASFEATSRVAGQTMIAFSCGAGQESDSHWNSYVDGTVLYLPKARYELETFVGGSNNKDAGPDVAARDYRFTGDVKSVAYGVSQFLLNYAGDSYNGYPRKHVHRLVMHAEVSGLDVAASRYTGVAMRITGGIRDKSGVWDDAYQHLTMGPLIGIKKAVAKHGGAKKIPDGPAGEFLKDKAKELKAKRKTPDPKKEKVETADLAKPPKINRVKKGSLTPVLKAKAVKKVLKPVS